MESLSYCKIIRNLREDADLTQQQVAEVLKTSQPMYASYEGGVHEMPIRHLISLCRLYQVSADSILGLTDETEAATPQKELLYTPENLELLRLFEEFLLARQKRKK